MLNQYPLWKYILLVVGLIIASIYALPNLYGEDPAVQVSHRTKSLTEEDKLLIQQTITGKELTVKSIELKEGHALARFNDTDAQLRAADALKENLGKQYSSPVLANGLVYMPNDEGVITVIKPGTGFESVAQNAIGERMNASPAISNGRIYLRGEKHLFCIGTKNTE